MNVTSIESCYEALRRLFFVLFFLFLFFFFLFLVFFFFLLVLLVLLAVFDFVFLALFRLFVQIADAFFTQEHLGAAVGGAQAEGVFIVVTHEAAHLFTSIEYDDDRNCGLHQLFHVPALHPGALDARGRSLFHRFLFAFGRALLALLPTYRFTEFTGFGAEFTASARFPRLSPE